MTRNSPISNLDRVRTTDASESLTDISDMFRCSSFIVNNLIVAVIIENFEVTGACRCEETAQQDRRGEIGCSMISK